MKRKEFVKQCGLGCMTLLVAPSLLEGCGGARYIQAPIFDSHLIIPTSAFEIVKNNSVTFRKYIVAQNTTLQYPICVYRLAEDRYHALWMKCTHQGTELQVFGDTLQCPAHGSEFTSIGAVKNGPADEALRTFAVALADNNLKISLQ